MSTPFRHPQQSASRSDYNIKPPKAPDRPLVPYMRFSRKMWSKVRAENPEAQLWDIGKIIGALWRDTPESEKSIYQQEYEIEKVEYEKAIKNYHNSHAYQQYLAQKNRAKMNEKTSRARIEGGGVVIQPVDEDEYHNELTARRLAAVRFDRNHRLIADLFSNSVVTDTRTIVAQNRMDMLKKQAQSLASHQTKLMEELNRLDEVHNEKKRHLERGSEEFAESLKKVCDERPQITDEKFEEMVEEWKGKLLDAYADYKKKQEEMNAKLAAEREKIVEATPVLAELVMGDDIKSSEPPAAAAPPAAEVPAPAPAADPAPAEAPPAAPEPEAESMESDGPAPDAAPEAKEEAKPEEATA